MNQRSGLHDRNDSNMTQPTSMEEGVDVVPALKLEDIDRQLIEAARRGERLALDALVRRNDHLMRASFEVLFAVALVTLPVYLTGVAAGNAIEGLDGVAVEAIRTHETAALLAFTWMMITGFFAWLALWQSRRLPRPTNASVGAVLLLAVLTTALMARAATIGGETRHPEILVNPEAASVGAPTGWLTSGAIVLRRRGVPLPIGRRVVSANDDRRPSTGVRDWTPRRDTPRQPGLSRRSGRAAACVRAGKTPRTAKRAALCCVGNQDGRKDPLPAARVRLRDPRLGRRPCAVADPVRAAARRLQPTRARRGAGRRLGALLGRGHPREPAARVLVLAGLFEIGWAVGLKYTEGFTRPLPTLATLAAMAVSLALLGLAGHARPVHGSGQRGY